MENNSKIKVLIVDDSALIRELLEQILSSDPDIEVVGKASNAYIAVDKIKALKPDVITLDINMPKVNGLVFLDKLMKSNPIPVIMISSLTSEGSDETILALELGAIDFIKKPEIDIKRSLNQLNTEIISKVKIAASSEISKKRKTLKSVSKQKITFDKTTEKVIAIGSSTGGIEAISTLLNGMPDNIPPTVIVQHIPPGFEYSLAKRLNTTHNFTVKIAEEGEILKSGTVLISQSGKHLTIDETNSNYLVRYIDTEKVNSVKPSVDILMDSVANVIGKNAIGVILTGMGKDGALGMKKVKNIGGITFAQNEESCIVYGMPKEAIKIGAIDYEVDIYSLASEILKHC